MCVRVTVTVTESNIRIASEKANVKAGTLSRVYVQYTVQYCTVPEHEHSAMREQEQASGASEREREKTPRPSERAF